MAQAALSSTALDAVVRAIAALTYPLVERIGTDGDGRLQVTNDGAVPLLHRSIAQDLLQIERVIGARGATLLSANATAIDEALVALDEARQLLAGTAETRPGPIGNVKPAPFFLAEPVARALVDPDAPSGPRSVNVPVAAEPLVDRPRRSEDPRLARANDDAVPEVSGQGAVPADAEPFTDLPTSEPASGRAPAKGKKPRRGKPPLSAGEPARKIDVMHRQAKDRDARELEQPIDRMAVIRAAAQKLALPATTSDCRALPGKQAEPARIAIPPLPAFARRQRLQAAIMHLKRQCILVSPVDRSALVRRYRVSGKREPMYAEEVIAFAATRGFQIEGEPA